MSRMVEALACLSGTGPDYWKEPLELYFGQSAKGRRLRVRMDQVVKGRRGADSAEVEGGGEEQQEEEWGGELQDECGILYIPVIVPEVGLPRNWHYKQ